MAVDQIGTKALVDCSVAAADIADGTITSAKLAGSIANAKLSNSSITVNGTSIALGASGAVPPVQWQSVVVSDGSTVTTMVAGRGYFVNNTSAAGIVKLPASATAGDIVSIKDYAGNFGTNSLTIQRNSHKIQGNTNDSTISTNRASITLVYVDATKGWLYTNESNVADLENKTYIDATGGTITTSGNFKIHTFTGDGNFVVSSLGNSVGGGSWASTVDYMVVAGGASGGASSFGAGGGGGGGFREGRVSSPTYTASPLVAPAGLSVTAATFPITIGAGGSGVGPSARGNSGANSIFSTITSAGGGAGGGTGCGPVNVGVSGGSGGGGAVSGGGALAAGSGNTPPVSPPQGNDGGNGAGDPTGGQRNGGGGGGASAAGEAGNDNSASGRGGGAGVTTCISASPIRYSDGSGGSGGASGSGPYAGSPGGPTAGSSGFGTGGNGGANTGGAGGASGANGSVSTSGNGGSGRVVIRYKYQN